MNTIEDVYPLTIISIPFQKIVILNCISNHKLVYELNLYNIPWLGDRTIEEYISDTMPGLNFGIGETVEEAFANFLCNRKRKLLIKEK